MNSQTILQPLPGAVVRDFKRCGHPGCKCASGELHGPYFGRRWYEGGKQRREYIKESDVPRVRAAIELHDLEARISKQRAYLRLNISRKSREWALSLIATWEQEAKELREQFPEE